MKLHHAALCAIALVATPVAALALTIDAGLSYVLIDPAARKIAGAHYQGTEDNDTLASPYIRFSAAPKPDWIVGVSYSYYRIRTSGGFYWDGPAITQLAMRGWQTENLHEIALDVRYQKQFSPNLRFEVGPVLSCLWSKATTDIYTVSSAPTWLWAVRDSDSTAELGGVAALRYTVSDSLTVTFGYRYERAWGRDLHLFSGGMGFSF